MPFAMPEGGQAAVNVVRQGRAGFEVDLCRAAAAQGLRVVSGMVGLVGFVGMGFGLIVDAPEALAAIRSWLGL
jgi:hypothetical protein